VGLELAFAAAPASMKSLITAFWLAMVSLGNLLNTRITPLYKERFSPGDDRRGSDFCAVGAAIQSVGGQVAATRLTRLDEYKLTPPTQSAGV
jgi:dipeptide/tripeptide permease